MRELLLGDLAPGAQASVDWDGKRAGGGFAADGQYTVQAFQASGPPSFPFPAVVVDNTNPTVGIAPISGASPGVPLANGIEGGVDLEVPDPLPGRTYGDAPFALEASASSGLPVSLEAGGGACSLDGNLVTIAAAGSCTITARQAGDEEYDPAPEVSRPFAVARAPLTVTADDARMFFGAAGPLPFEARLSGLENGETSETAGISGQPGFAGSATSVGASSPAGSYALTPTLGTLSAANYSTTAADEGSHFRYDPGDQQYIYNLKTKDWQPGTYRLTAHLDDGSSIEVLVEARAK